jgi:GNAT superfamily N-acetyltransferase
MATTGEKRREWRAMAPGELPAVVALADRIHVGHPERPEIFAERLRLCPEGALVFGRGREVVGYGLGHPWILGRPPLLDTLLGELPAAADVFHLHDVAVDAAARGEGAAVRAVARFSAVAAEAGLTRLSLVAVDGAEALWRRFGFEERVPADPDGLRASYGADARFMLRGLADPSA